jgi:hypothetical protein
MKDFAVPLLILLGIICIALFGGVKNEQQNTATTTNIMDQGGLIDGPSNSSVPPPSQQQLTQDEIAYRLGNAQNDLNRLQQQVNAGHPSADMSQYYKGKISIQWGSITTNPDQEYMEIDANSSNAGPINITGWKLMSTSTGQTIIIPQSTGLYQSNTSNYNENVILSPGERVYLISGRSSIYYGFHANICSGYLNQFNTFTPGLYTSCPAARDENLTSIPRTANNNNCFDLIDSIGSCQTYTQSLNNSYSSQCQQFIETKLNYQSCVDTHKNDSNFYSPKVWYVYLNRDQSIWQPRRDTVILYDQSGKEVYRITH